MDLADFNYTLPQELIAQSPVTPRDASRLMQIDRKQGSIKHGYFYNLPDLLNANDVLVVNNTKVIPMRIMAYKKTGGLIEILLIKPSRSNLSHWVALAKPMKRIKIGEQITLVNEQDSWTITVIESFEHHDGFKRLIVDIGQAQLLYKRLNDFGWAPLPPYIEQDLRKSRLKDITDYQTIFAKDLGAVAAPTAGMHFTDNLLQVLKAKNISILEITLHVGIGTFKPVTVNDIDDHLMETEEYSISQETALKLNEAKLRNQRIIAVGTTTVRTLESAYYNHKINATKLAKTNLFIKPGYEWKFIDGLITNFHLSKSSLLIMVSAFAGIKLIRDAYEQAIQAKYRFYSYGDSMIIL